MFDLYEHQIPRWEWEYMQKKARAWDLEWLTWGRILEPFSSRFSIAEQYIIERIYKALPDIKLRTDIEGVEELYLKYCAIKDRVK